MISSILNCGNPGGREDNMARTTAAEVKQIIDVGDLTDTEVDAFISGANALVTEVVGSDTTIGVTLKEEIERWLTAHMIAATRQRQLVSGEAGGAKAVYQGKTGMGLNSTLYGQQVTVLDSTGNFAALGGKKASMVAIASWND